MVETIIPREMLYIADEVFFSGTAAEITPIRSIDRITVGTGRRGPIAERLQKEFFGVINGTREDTHGWLSPVHALVGEGPPPQPAPAQNQGANTWAFPRKTLPVSRKGGPPP